MATPGMPSSSSDNGSPAHPRYPPAAATSSTQGPTGWGKLRWSRSTKAGPRDQTSTTELEISPAQAGSTSTQSRPTSLLTSGSSSGHTYDEEVRYRTMVTYLANRVAAFGWIPPHALHDPASGLGVLLRQSRGHYACHPEQAADSALLGAARRLNVGVLVTMQLATLPPILAGLGEGQAELAMQAQHEGGYQLQVVESLAAVGTAACGVRKFQYAAIVRREGLLLAWQDDAAQILPHAQKMEDRLLSYVWHGGRSAGGLSPLQSPTPFVSNYSMHLEKGQGAAQASAQITALDFSEVSDQEGGQMMDAPALDESVHRPVVLHSAVFIGMGVCLALVLVYGFAAGQLVSEALLDGRYARLALLAACPLLICAGMFFFQVIFGDLWQMAGPLGGLQTNSRTYSCHKPNLRRAYALGFRPPHVTIQMPVYKEGLANVIGPSVKSLQAAISFYESRGGTASVFVNDDGLRLLPPDEARARRDFYQDHDIGWVARPPHGDAGYLRRGKFKKASNMNFALNVSQRVEAYMQDAVEARCAQVPGFRAGQDPLLLEEPELEAIYQECLQRVLAEDPRARAGGNIRIGEFILIVDSDTRVPVDCLLYGAAEMFLSPEVGIVQHSTGVMQVVHDYFENGITFFTNMVYTAIRFSIGSGEVAPFVGHNAFLRWAAVQDVGVVSQEEEQGFVAYWSESHVSEDFDIALRMQIRGSTVRVASYHGDGFKEGVSLTIYDEIARWQKYAYGCSEMIFHPFYKWPTKGPFTPLIRTFLGSGMQLSSKTSVFAYICSYFAIGAGLPMTVLNYFLVGWFDNALDHFYLPSWKVFVSLLVVFNLGGGAALAVLRYRTGEQQQQQQRGGGHHQGGLLASLAQNFKWTPMLAVFFGGLSFHVGLALLAHLFHVDMQWGATAKEKEDSNFFHEVPKILKKFKYLYLFVVLLTGAMIYLSAWAPRGWTITDFTAVVPMSVVLGSHALTPLVLNPSLMIFNY